MKLTISMNGNGKEMNSFCFTCFNSTKQKMYFRDGFWVLKCCKCHEELLFELD